MGMGEFQAVVFILSVDVLPRRGAAGTPSDVPPAPPPPPPDEYEYNKHSTTSNDTL